MSMSEPRTMRVLVVEDDPASLRLMQEMLKHSTDGPFSTDGVETLAEGLELLGAGDPYEVLVLDLSLPDSAGVRTVERVREAYPDIPIVVVSGQGDEQAIFEAMERGVQDYIVKDHLEPRLVGKTLRYAINSGNAERSREKTERLLLAFMNNVPDCVFFKDADSRFTRINRAMARRLGFSDPSIIIGKSDRDFFPEAHATQTRLDEQRVLETGAPLIDKDEHLIWPDGRVSWVSTTKLPLYGAQGEVVGTFGISRDITKRVQSEQERQRAELRGRREERLRSLGVMAGGIAHDFNNLLMGIIGYAELALTDPDASDRIRNYLAVIKKTGFRAAELCRQMLLYSGSGSPKLEDVDFSKVIADMSQIIKVTVSSRIRVRYALADNLPLVHADTAQLREMTLSLLSNASDAIGDDEGEIHVVTSVKSFSREDLGDAFSEVQLPSGAYVVLDVKDSGCGMAAGEIEQILDPFFSTKFPGRGLGLAAVTGIIRGHLGGLKIASAKGEGSTFSVLLPPREAGVVADEADAIPAKCGKERDAILIVDDESVVRGLAEHMVGMLGFVPLKASSGEQGIKMFQESHQRIAVVLLDMTMPGMDGNATLVKLREADPDVRVIFCSGYTRERVADRLGEARVADFIHKPYTIHALKDSLSRVLGYDLTATDS